ncbi:MAG: TetR/AcrR family transcriptional regulator [Limnohabitans sp.]|jgi:AcrR family transcriptional regulator
MKDSPSATQTISESGDNIDASGIVISDILEVATREFAAHGLAGARIEKIQQQTRTSKRMIYYHFGSKEGLYRAVIERAFEMAREVDKDFDPQKGTPEQALKQIANNAFEAFTQNPSFVRLLTFENLAGAPYIRQSQHASRLNRMAMADLESVLKRGHADGSIRKDVKPLDVYINMVGLCYYHVAHYAGYLAAGFQSKESSRIQSDAFHKQRRRAIQDACWRYVKAEKQ